MKIAIIRIRGRRSIAPKIKKTLELLNLRRPNHCIVIDDTAYTKGMLKIVKDYVAFGPINETALVDLLSKRGKKGKTQLIQISNEIEIQTNAKKIMEGAKIKDLVDPVFTLKPPSKGWKDIKQPYPRGDLGPRPDISLLVKRML